MEQKNVDKIKRIAEEVVRQEKEINERYQVLRSEFLTKDVLGMIHTISDAKHRIYAYHINSNFELWINDGVPRIIYTPEGNSTVARLRIPFDELLCMHNVYGRDAEISVLTAHAERIAKEKKWLQIIQDELPEIIEDITEQYREITETQSDVLDGLLDSLGVENTPIKHIRVTVEWL